MLWGYLSDRFPRRRRFLAFNYLGYAVVFAALSQFHSLTVLLLLYMAVGLLAPAEYQRLEPAHPGAIF